MALLFSQVQRSNEEEVIFSSSAEWWQSILHTYVLRAWGLMIWTQKESPIVCEFEVTKRQDSTKQERQRKVCMTKDYFFETWVDHVVSVHRLDKNTHFSWAELFGKYSPKKKENKKGKNCRLLSLPSSTHSNWWFLLWLPQLEGYTWGYCEWEGCQRSDAWVPVLENHSILPWWERGLCCQHCWLDWHQQEHSIQHSAGIFLLPCTSRDAIISSILPGLLIRHCKI